MWQRTLRQKIIEGLYDREQQQPIKLLRRRNIHYWTFYCFIIVSITVLYLDVHLVSNIHDPTTTNKRDDSNPTTFLDNVTIGTSWQRIDSKPI